MNHTIAKSAVTNALEATIVSIESSFAKGHIGIQLLGHAGEVCRDGRERAKTALEKCGYDFPHKRLIINIAPADLKKDGNHLDLPLAVSIALLLDSRKTVEDASLWVFAAELGLNGELRPVKGIVSIALASASKGLKGIIVARENLSETSILSKLGGNSFGDFQIVGLKHISDVMKFLITGQCDELNRVKCHDVVKQPEVLNFDDMILHTETKRLILTVGAGFHSVLLRGSPGSGKSMLAARLNSVLPNMSKKEHLEALQIQSLSCERLSPNLLEGLPPYRSPHHQASAAAIIGNTDSPGELSLAHGGILFLDEFPEFRRDIIEALREPLESGSVHVSRSDKKVSWRSRILLVAACNNCPCGWSGSKRRVCCCTSKKRLAYSSKISGPILDRIDIHFNSPEPQSDHSHMFLRLKDGDSIGQTASLREHISQARDRAAFRNRKYGCKVNSQIKAKFLMEATCLSSKSFEELIHQFTRPSSSPRSVVKCLRLARTLADLDDESQVSESHFKMAWNWQEETSALDRGELPGSS